MGEPLKYANGKPCIPLFKSEEMVPNFLTRNTHLANAASKNDTRLRIFSGTANPSLSQVYIFGKFYHLGLFAFPVFLLFKVELSSLI